jgi:outer membrane receptor protein involved in Fe transport
LAGVSEPVLSCCFPTRNASKSEDFDISAKIDGSLFEVPAGDVRVAIGGGYTRDQLRVGVTAGAEDATSAAYKLSRSLQYGFAEVYVPIIAPQQNIPGISRLEATVAGRYTHYSDFGSNLSPKFGLTWEPTGGIKIRGTFSKSFRAPFLSQLDAADTNYLVFPISLFPAVQSMFNIDPNKYLIGVFGNNTASKAERANTWTAGIDLTPASIPGLRASFTYFKINYSGRIAAPGATDTLFNPANYGSLFVANPSSAAIANAITGALDSANLSPVDGSDPAALAGIAGVLYDDRNVNLSYSRISGSDIQVDFTRSWLNLGAQSTIIFSYKKKVSPQTDPISAMNTVGQPISFRGRAWIGANRDAWSSQISLNYVNDYRNLANPAQSKVGSWTTVDFSASYRFSAVNGPLKGLELSMAVQNIFDRSPPFVALASDTSIPGIVDAVGFDPSNANPLGRFISFNLKKSF